MAPEESSSDEESRKRYWPVDWLPTQWKSGRGDGIHLTVLYHNKRFHISLNPPTSSDTIEGPLISKFDRTIEENKDKIWDVQWDIQKVIYEAGGSLWDELAPPLNETEHPRLDLYTVIYPETFSFRFITKDGKAELIRLLESRFYDDPFGLKITDDTGLPQYPSKDVHILETLPGLGCIAKVSVGGEEMCCKSGNDIDRALEREFECLRKVAQSPLAPSIRVPELLGLITKSEEEPEIIIGILEEYIPTGTIHTLVDLEDLSVEVSAQSIQKWGTQIQKTLDSLHKVGVIWGDGKPQNILIHEETDEAWVIDFGGGYTRGWVDEKLMETLEGDEQAVTKILEYLNSMAAKRRDADNHTETG
ncbi:hypothetical protein F4777DRAFT_271409 [Nemania sp. FL0916]|nr:hypothetical protein F4777DRAFT_271409 [Nemania sp. FL0916]